MPQSRSDAALQHDGQGHPVMMKVHLCQLLLIKKDIMRGQIPFCSLLIQFAGIKENWALNPFRARNSFTAGQMRRIADPLCRSQEMESSETMTYMCDTFTTQTPPFWSRRSWKIKAFIRDQRGSVVFALIHKQRPMPSSFNFQVFLLGPQ